MAAPSHRDASAPADAADGAAADDVAADGAAGADTRLGELAAAELLGSAKRAGRKFRRPASASASPETWRAFVGNLAFLLREGLDNYIAPEVEGILGGDVECLDHQIEMLVKEDGVALSCCGRYALRGAVATAVTMETRLRAQYPTLQHPGVDAIAAAVSEAALAAAAAPAELGPDVRYPREAFAIVGRGADAGPVPPYPALFRATVELWAADTLRGPTTLGELLGSAAPLLRAYPKKGRPWLLGALLGLRAPCALRGLDIPRGLAAATLTAAGLTFHWG